MVAMVFCFSFPATSCASRTEPVERHEAKPLPIEASQVFI
jgi:hypothetical protein